VTEVAPASVACVSLFTHVIHRIAMRIASALVASLFALPLVLAACGGNNKMDVDPFASLQACFDEHHVMEHFTVQQSIVVCCLDHPIGPSGEHPSCKDTQVDCVAHVRAELDASVVDADIQGACTTYITMK
jgi:hypothetical protein